MKLRFQHFYGYFKVNYENQKNDFAKGPTTFSDHKWEILEQSYDNFQL